MPILLRLDIGALYISIVLASGAALSVLGAGAGKSVNRRFTLYALSVAAWAILTLVLKIRMNYNLGDPLPAAEWSAFCVTIQGPLFLLFVARYGGIKSRRFDALAIGFLAAAFAFSVPLFSHRMLFDLHGAANGTALSAIGAWGYAAAAIPVSSMAVALILIFRRRRDLGEYLVPAGAVLVAAGFLLSDLAQVRFPVHSVSSAMGLALLSFAVMRRQLFNPMAQEVLERRRMEHDLQRRVEHQDLIARIGARTTALLSQDDLLRQAVDLVEEAFGFYNVCILLSEGDELVLSAAALPAAQARAGALRLRIGAEGITGWVAASGQSLYVPDVLRDPRYVRIVEEEETRSEMAVPIRLRGQIIGVLDAQSAAPDAFQAADADTLRTVADQLAVAIQNARLFATVRRDLEERRRAEEGLRESETLFRNVAEQSPNIMFLVWRGQIVYANRQCEVLTGIPPGEIGRPGFDILSLVAPESRDRILEGYRRYRAGERIQTFEQTFIARSGRRIDTVLTMQSIGYRGETAILGIAVDVTARGRMERLLRTLHAAALEMEQAPAPAGILPVAVRALGEAGFRSVLFLADPERRAVAVRCHFVRGTPVVTEEGDPERMALRLDEVPFLASALGLREAAAATLAMDSLPHGVPSLRGSGTEPLPVILAPLRTGDDALGVLLVHGEWMGEEVLQPLTVFAHQIAAAWRKTKLVRDLERSLADLHRTQAQLLQSQKMEAIGRLAGGIAHDFNNVLTVISGYASLLGESLHDRNKAQSDLAEIRGAVKRAAALTGRLLAFGRRQEVHPSVLDLDGTVAGCVKLLRPLIREDVALDLRTSGGRTTVMADPNQMDQIIMNLALNAQDAMPAGGLLSLETGTRDLAEAEAAGLGIPPGGYSALTVRDTGIGMDNEVKSRIFEPFFTTKGDGKGSGLGLSIVYGIVAQWGGAIRVESAPGRGSSFTIFLPVSGEAPAAARTERSERLPMGRGTILLAEDDGSVRDLARRILQEAGYRVLSAGSGEEALHTASVSGAIGLLITDVVMPGGLSGVDLFHRIRRVRPGLPVLFMSGYADAEDRRYRVPAGLPFLAKPFHPERFLRMAGELLAGTSAP